MVSLDDGSFILSILGNLWFCVKARVTDRKHFNIVLDGVPLVGDRFGLDDLTG